jgi:hypothetical protein
MKTETPEEKFNRLRDQIQNAVGAERISEPSPHQLPRIGR